VDNFLIASPPHPQGVRCESSRRIDPLAHSYHSLVTQSRRMLRFRVTRESRSNQPELIAVAGRTSGDSPVCCRHEGVRTVVLAKTKKGYGFVLRGAKGM